MFFVSLNAKGVADGHACSSLLFKIKTPRRLPGEALRYAGLMERENYAFFFWASKFSSG
jgi:hypothetical protein